ncbi:MAG: type VII toxin-antitoxin system HepT family RNase toxin [Gammaproteobacteria bacterium]
MTIDRVLVERKLRGIETYLSELDRHRFASLEAFSSDVVLKRFAERNLELAIERMIDVCKHMVAAMSLPQPETYADCFKSLAAADVIPSDDADTFQKMARFRNLLVHGYETVEDSVTFDVLTEKTGDFRRFVDVVRDHLKTV